MGLVDATELYKLSKKTSNWCLTDIQLNSLPHIKDAWWHHFAKKSEIFIQSDRTNKFLLDWDQSLAFVNLLEEFDEFHCMTIKMMYEKKRVRTCQDFPHKINLPMKLFVDKHNIIPEYEPTNKKVRKTSPTNQRDRKTLSANQNDTTTNLQINFSPVNQNEREKLEIKNSDRKISNEEDIATLQKVCKEREISTLTPKESPCNTQCFVCKTRFEELFVEYLKINKLSYSQIEAIVRDTDDDIFVLLNLGIKKVKEALKSLYLCLPGIELAEISTLQNLWLYHFKVKHRKLYQVAVAVDHHNILPSIQNLRKFNSYFYQTDKDERNLECKEADKEILLYEKAFKDIEENKLGLKEAFVKYNIPYRKAFTLMKRRSIIKETSLPIQVEIALVVYIQSCEQINNPRSEHEIRQLALLLACENNFPITKLLKYISSVWWLDFIARYPVVLSYCKKYYNHNHYKIHFKKNLLLFKDYENFMESMKNKFFEILVFIVNKREKDFNYLIKKYNTGKPYVSKTNHGQHNVNVKGEITDQTMVVDKLTKKDH